MGIVRILLLADTHLGFDWPFRPRIQRRRRGVDFFKNFENALASAIQGKVDGVVHAGDLLYRSKVPARLVEMAVAPLKQVASTGIPVFVVPGNHERSHIPHGQLAQHPNIHIFHQPRTFYWRHPQGVIAVAGFPFVRVGIRRGFKTILNKTGWQRVQADAHLLCVHQCVEGATVGPSGYTFRYAPDVIRLADIPAKFAGVLAGHIHRFQVLTTDLRKRPLSFPVFYPGAIERTSFAERNEAKGYVTLSLEIGAKIPAAIRSWKFHVLYTRPMRQIDLHLEAFNNNKGDLKTWLQEQFRQLPSDSVVKLKIHGKPGQYQHEVLRAPSVRQLAQATHNVEMAWADQAAFRRKKGPKNIQYRQALIK